MSKEFKIPLLKELRDQQVRYVPRDKKLEQLARAEELLYDIPSLQMISYKYIFERITDFRPELHEDRLFDSDDAKHDILRFIEDLADSFEIPIESVTEPVWTIEQLAERFNVSQKTISRWKKQGLASRRFIIDGKKRVGFLDSTVNRFVQNDPNRISRGEKFSQLSEQERDTLLQQAKELAAKGHTPTQAARKLAKKSGRSPETIRYILKTFDESNRGQEIFPNRNSPLSEDEKKEVYNGFRRGNSVENLAKKYNRTRSSIYNIVGQFRARRILDFPLNFIDSPEFEAAFTAKSRKKENEILGLTRQISRVKKNQPQKQEQPDDADDVVGSDVFVETDTVINNPAESLEKQEIPNYFAGLLDVPLLTPQEETHLFRKMNYLLFKASKLRESVDIENPKIRVMSEIEKLYDEAVQTKNKIISANLRLVVSIAKRHLNQYVELFELVSDGNISLIKAVEKFDYMRGNKFSTYATWAIMKNFARSLPDEQRYRERFHPCEIESFSKTEDFRVQEKEYEIAARERKYILDHLLDGLSVNEQQIIVSRFGLGDNNTPHTLKEVSTSVHVTKERVRQIEIRALAKLRNLAEKEDIALPE
ncbi:MAG: sigma-70 family RNA polymerase sigma factor [Thermoguttaceae bacterium]